MTRPTGSYRSARRNEARESRQGGKRLQALTYAEVLKINAVAAANAQAAARAAAKGDPYRSARDGFEPLGPKTSELAHASA